MTEHPPTAGANRTPIGIVAVRVFVLTLLLAIGLTISAGAAGARSNPAAPSYGRALAEHSTLHAAPLQHVAEFTAFRTDIAPSEGCGSACCGALCCGAVAAPETSMVTRPACPDDRFAREASFAGPAPADDRFRPPVA